MLVLALYQVPEKKAKKKKNKEAGGSLRHKGTSDAVSGETKISSCYEGDEDEEEEEEESNSPLKEKKKRAVSADLEAKAPKKERISLSDGSDADAEDIPEWRPRSKPLAAS